MLFWWRDLLKEDTKGWGEPSYGASYRKRGRRPTMTPTFQSSRRPSFGLETWGRGVQQAAWERELQGESTPYTLSAPKYSKKYSLTGIDYSKLFM